MACLDSICRTGSDTDQTTPVENLVKFVVSGMLNARQRNDTNMPIIEVTAIPAFSDNYIWLISTGGNSCAVVDPGDAQPVIEALGERDLQLDYILITHHHPDHIGGVPELQARTGAIAYGPHDSRISGQSRSFTEGETVMLPLLGLEFTVIEVPGHTASHIAFHGHGCLFCGDTLFSVGCGRLFEGSPGQMQASLDKMAELPPETMVYCAHEYTLSNCQFALAVEPDNHDLVRRTQAVKASRAAGKSTVPSSLGEELSVNPFLRCRQESVIAAARKRQPDVHEGAETLAVIRAWKDTF
jgi:hydroxyacylglutathione hydrolase